MALTKVTNTGIADDAVTTDKIEDGTVVAADIAPGTIANAKLANSSITLNGSSVSLGGSATLKHIDWQALTVADGSTTLTTEAGKGYFLDTNAGVIEVFLPSSPTRGDTVVLADYSGTFATNQIIINTGGELLDSTAGNDFKVTTNNSIVELIYVDSAKGWLVKLNQAAGTTPSSVMNAQGGYDTLPPFISATGGTVTESGDFKIHTFTGDGCFVVSGAGDGTSCHPSIVDYLVVAGGGGGGVFCNSGGGGGGGGGGFRESKASASPTHTASPHTASPLVTTTGITVTATTYPITVGAGGAGRGSTPGGDGSQGSPSIFSTITSAGGGFGSVELGGDGGSGGGGGGGANASPPTAAGSGNTPPVSPPQGNNGGDGNGSPSPGSRRGGGGGGAGAAGGPSASCGGVGGNGVNTSITGSSTGYSGGGGGSNVSPGAGATSFGATPGSSGTTTDGTANTGGGAGGSNSSAGSGGKGIVVIRYKFQ